MRIGFIGTGVITKAVVTGLIRSGFAFDEIVLSPRNAETAATLAAMDGRVEVCASNQEVLDRSDLVCIAVLPRIVHEVLADLRFGQLHEVITFVPEVSIDDLRRMTQPARRVTRAVPLPAVADGKGVTAIFPHDDLSVSLFSALGEAVVVEGEREFDGLHAVTSTMASFYAVLEAQTQWLVAQGLSYATARAFLSGYSIGLASETAQTSQSFPEMIDYLMTPGGLNAQVHAELTDVGSYDAYGPALDRVLARVRGQQ